MPVLSCWKGRREKGRRLRETGRPLRRFLKLEAGSNPARD
ncbi:hypothetical protein GDI1872 [Gluconacetobacter diazotrophicus PA1 5]|uniref:Uncharacterized protein n=1 Tax=Gluconacetobacter diazotrophicus (strain ATCC 49037 / DSM 5601 / CCUG 37298 / CIP 103539 / LMG 7603 / PAl5) TaxID=272568 RepID=A9HIU3_GLUDA|nr:hypothetical protein GDI1872 [Gluconacetobacter diazotrophicus PA1 5]